MSHRWFVAKQFFDSVPYPLTCHERQDGDFLMLVPSLHPEVVFLNRPGAFLYHQCDGQRTVLDVLKRYMVEHLRADRDEVAYEVMRILRQLESHSALYLLPPERYRRAGENAQVSS
jgi:hypothetical protein